MTTTPDLERPPASVSAEGAVRDESELARRVEEFSDAYQARDVDRLLALFTDDAEVTAAPGTFRGTDEIRRFFEWDVRLSPTASVRRTGIGVLVAGQRAVRESVIAATAEGIPYELPGLSVFEFESDGRIRRLRSYYDKLALLDRIASRYPGIKGRIFRRLTGYLVAQGEKGLERPSS